MSKKKQKLTKAKKRRLIFFGIPSFIAILYFLVTVPIYVIKIYNLKVEEKNLSQNLIKMQAEEKSLKTEIEKLKDEEYLAKYARENYQYSKDGELVFQLSEDDKEKNDEIKPININTNYILIGGSSIIFLIFLYAVKKHR